MSQRTVQLEVLRYRPEQDSEPFFQTYSVPCEEEWVVLDALNYVKDEMDRTLSYRWSCHMFVCGSCGMVGDDVLALLFAVVAAVHVVAVRQRQRRRSGKGRIEAVLRARRVAEQAVDAQRVLLERLELGRRLHMLAVVDRLPLLGNDVRLHAGQLVDEIVDDDDQIPLDREVGQRLDVDLVAVVTEERLAGQFRLAVADHDGVWACSFVGACSEVCPKDVDPAGAIQQMKITSAIDYVVSMLPGGGK